MLCRLVPLREFKALQDRHCALTVGAACLRDALVGMGVVPVLCLVGGLELYDHKNDPQENINIANLPENTELVEKLTRQLEKGWQAALPKQGEQ